MEWANYIRRHSFLAHLLFSLSLEHYLPASMLEAKLHNNTEEAFCPLCLECDYLYKLGAFGYRSIVAAQWGQHYHCGVLSRTCAQGELVIGKHLHASLCAWLQEFTCCLPFEREDWHCFPCGDLGWIFKTLWHPAISTQLVLICGILTVAFVEVLPLP